MSWDVILESAPAGDGPADAQKPSLGPMSRVIAVLSEACPRAEFGATNGILDEGDFSIEFWMSTDPVDSIMLSVRGSDAAIGTIQRICKSTGWRALDMTTGEYLDFDADPAKGFRQWRDFRDKVAARYEAQGMKVEKDVPITVPVSTRKWWQFWK